MKLNSKPIAAHFEIENYIGTGSFGCVFSGHDLFAGDKVAIKIVFSYFNRLGKKRSEKIVSVARGKNL